METNKLDKKKLIIMLIPVIISGMIYLLFFGKKENIPAKENSESFIIPNSSTEDIPASKAEIYKKEWERENKKQREKEDSQISSEYFYSLGGNTEKEKEKQQLSQKESIEKISELLPASGNTKPPGLNLKKRNGKTVKLMTLWHLIKIFPEKRKRKKKIHLSTKYPSSRNFRRKTPCLKTPREYVRETTLYHP